jgi:hypothetical protein
MEESHLTLPIVLHIVEFSVGSLDFADEAVS